MSDHVFKDLLEEIEALHTRKSADYANGEDPYINFKLSANQVGITPGQSVEVLIATKQARLKELLGKGKTAQNESVRDTLIDRIVYSMIAVILYDQGHYSPKAKEQVQDDNTHTTIAPDLLSES